MIHERLSNVTLGDVLLLANVFALGWLFRPLVQPRIDEVRRGVGE